MKYKLLIPALTLLSGFVCAQFLPAANEDISLSYDVRKNLAQLSLLKNYPARCIGPVVQGGRVSDLEVNPDNPKEFYVAFASGGLFRTINNGITFKPIFDDQGALGVGDFAIAPSDRNVLYVGTGEKNSSRSSYAGSGVYRSNNKGEDWSFLGLENIQHTSRVLVHPEDPETVWVAAIGALYSHNEARGVYKMRRMEGPAGTRPFL